MAGMVALPCIYKTSVKDLGVSGNLQLDKLGLTFTSTNPKSSLKICIEFRTIKSQKCSKQGGKSPPLLNLIQDLEKNYIFQFQDFAQRDLCKDFVSRFLDAGKKLSDQNDIRKRKQRVALKSDISSSCAKLESNGMFNYKVVLDLRPEIIQRVFSERPSICEEYLRSVPSKMSINEFWTKYAKAEYFLSTKNEAGALAETAEDETLVLFLKRDVILENEARRKIHRVDPTLNMEADEESDNYKKKHEDPDALNPRSLGQSLNQHSTVVLQGRVVDEDSYGDIRSLAEALSKARDGFDLNYRPEKINCMVEIEDLKGPKNHPFLPLKIKDPRDYFDSHRKRALKTAGESDFSTDHFDLKECLKEAKNPRASEPLISSNVVLKVFGSLNSVPKNIMKDNNLPQNIMNELQFHRTSMQKPLKMLWSTKHPFCEATKVKNDMLEVYEKLLKMKETVQSEVRHQVSLLVQPMLQVLDAAFAHYDTNMQK